MDDRETGVFVWEGDSQFDFGTDVRGWNGEGDAASLENGTEHRRHTGRGMPPHISLFKHVEETRDFE
jgi:hypothetical protein